MDECYPENPNQENEEWPSGCLYHVLSMPSCFGWSLSVNRLDAVLRHTIVSSKIRFWGYPKYPIDQGKVISMNEKDADRDRAELYFERGERHEIPRFWWFYLPVLFFALRYCVHLFSEDFVVLEQWFLGEYGLVENLTVGLLLLSLFTTIYVMTRFGESLHIVVKLFLLLYCMGCIYFAGEEASWGQHWLGWETGDYFLSANDQQETNFHNTSKWLDRVPKGIVSLLIFIGGVFTPLRFFYKQRKFNYDKLWWWLYPTWVCFPTAIFASLATWPSKIERATDVNFYFNQAQEVKELYIAYFILLFITSLYRRLTRLHWQGVSFSPR
jgi:hypothetical protein